MKYWLVVLMCAVFLISCQKTDPVKEPAFENPEFPMALPTGFPEMNKSFFENKPTKYGVVLGEKLFHDNRLSGNNTISCASCHKPSTAFADNNTLAIGIHGRTGLRNTPALQNLAYLRHYNWDGNMLNLETQTLVPIITHEEMNSSILEVINKISNDLDYQNLFFKAFGDAAITADRIYRSIAQYGYTLISANSKYDRVIRNEGAKFTEIENRGYQLFQLKCANCHSTELFTDQTFRNVGFPLNANPEEQGRARVTGLEEDIMKFRVPSLRNAEFTAPYGSAGQFPSLKAVLDYFDQGVLDAKNLDPILKNNGNRIPMTEQEKQDIIAFIQTLSDSHLVGK